MQYGELDVKVFPSRGEMGEAAAVDVVNRMKQLLAEQDDSNGVRCSPVTE